MTYPSATATPFKLSNVPRTSFLHVSSSSSNCHLGVSGMPFSTASTPPSQKLPDANFENSLLVFSSHIIQISAQRWSSHVRHADLRTVAVCGEGAREA